MADIFISYSKQHPQLTRDVADYVASEGYSVWWDTDLTAGEIFREVIDRELDAAKAVIVIWTTHSVASKWVLAEADHADRDGKLIPLRTRDLDARRIPKPYSTYHTDVVDDRAAILKAVRRVAGTPDHCVTSIAEIKDFDPYVRNRRYGGFLAQTSEPAKQVSKVPSEFVDKQAFGNVSVEFITEILPKTFGSDETVRALQLFPLPVANGGGGLPMWYNRSGTQWKWTETESSFPLSGYRCEVTNYGILPLFDFIMSLDLTFFEAEAVPGQPNAKKTRNNYITARSADRDPKTRCRLTKCVHVLHL